MKFENLEIPYYTRLLNISLYCFDQIQRNETLKTCQHFSLLRLHLSGDYVAEIFKTNFLLLYLQRVVGTLNVEAFKFSLKGIFHFHQNVIDMTVLCLQRETNCIKTMIVIWNILWIGFICICKLSPLHFVEVTPAIFSRERHCESQVSCPKKQSKTPVSTTRA